MTNEGPYRDSASENVPRYICIVCYEWATTAPGTCGKCSAPVLDIQNPEVLQMMHDEATITVNQQIRHGVLGTPKGRTRRVVPMTPTLLSALKALQVVRTGH